MQYELIILIDLRAFGNSHKKRRTKESACLRLSRQRSRSACSLSFFSASASDFRRSRDFMFLQNINLWTCDSINIQYKLSIFQRSTQKDSNSCSHHMALMVRAARAKNFWGAFGAVFLFFRNVRCTPSERVSLPRNSKYIGNCTSFL